MQELDRGGVRPIQDVLTTFLRKSGIARSADERVFHAWNTALGDRLCARARPVRLAAGELTVEVDSSPHLQELKSFTGERYRRAANRSLGQELIERVVYKLKL